ncbi:MAG: elongation factor P maturation arginine rhamnosyltransferase EarP [Neisseriaceae bacterium]|nr:elongation factor P maturation arginine rhamnosyltransferase EarP [Neisseriaceae bacterium]
MSIKSTWLFCQVIDNYGDIGVCWRLAQDLQSHAPVVLWVDDLTRFQALCPAIEPHLWQQTVAGVTVIRWSAAALRQVSLASLPSPTLLIEAFACDLPEAITQHAKAHNSLWLNLEYLSAEDWVADVHLMPSLQANGLAKYFYFPGFTPELGGLIREQGLIAARDALWAQPERQAAARQRLGLPERQSPDELTFFLFAYTSAALPMWLRAWQAQARPITVWVNPGQALDSLKAGLGVADDAPLEVGDEYWLGQVRVCVLPFVAQADFDYLLWLADLNIIRGEDSFVRALWAGKPYLWHIYQQQEDAHLPKLNAFWAKAFAAATDVAGQALRTAHEAVSLPLNANTALSQADWTQNWSKLLSLLPHWQIMSAEYSRAQVGLPSLRQKLTAFVKNKLE